MNEEYDAAALTNALTDITIKIGVDDLKKIKKDFAFLDSLKKEYFCAGSPANVIFNCACMGLKTALLGSLGNDETGKKYIEELEKYKIKPIFGFNNSDSGACYILLDNSGEKRCMTKMGTAAAYNFNLNNFGRAKIFHTSAYELHSNPCRMFETLSYVWNKRSLLSFDLADRNMVKKQKRNIESIIERTGILFMTEEEAEELTGKNPEYSLKEMSRLCNTVILKKGARGSVVKNKNQQQDIEIFPVKVASTCGAGDAYASGFIFGYLKGKNLKTCGLMGSYAASKVCGIIQPHLTEKFIFDNKFGVTD